MIKGLDAIRHHGLLQPMLYVGSALLMGRYVCRLPFKATIPLSCVALVAHELSQKQISLSQNILCWSGLGVGSSLIITKCSKEPAKKLPHLMGFWALVALISQCIRVLPAIVNNVLPNHQAPVAQGGGEKPIDPDSAVQGGAEEPIDPDPVEKPIDPDPVEKPIDPVAQGGAEEPIDPDPVEKPIDPDPVVEGGAEEPIGTFVPDEARAREVEERRQRYRRQSPFSEPLTFIDFFNDNGVLKAVSKNIMSAQIQLIDCCPKTSKESRYKYINGGYDISPIYLLMGAKTNLCFLQIRVHMGGDRFQGTVPLFSSQLQLQGATTSIILRNNLTLECEKRILEEVILFSSQLNNLAQFLVDLLSKDGDEVTMQLEEFNLIRNKVYEWAESLQETHLAPYDDSEKEFGYAILELEKELCQIDIPQPIKSARKV